MDIKTMLQIHEKLEVGYKTTISIDDVFGETPNEEQLLKWMIFNSVKNESLIDHIIGSNYNTHNLWCGLIREMIESVNIDGNSIPTNPLDTEDK